MIELLPRDASMDNFFDESMQNAYNFSENFVDPTASQLIYRELQRNDFLVDLIEMQSTSDFHYLEMPVTRKVHSEISRSLLRVSGAQGNLLSMFSVRVFEPGEHATTIHRNHPIIGPWAVGLTLSGSSPFNIYDQEDLPEDTVIPLTGTSIDPTPQKTMQTAPGSIWTLYTRDEQIPHSGGIVDSDEQRALLIFYSFM